MKKYIILLLTILSIQNNWAQNKKSHEQIRSLKVAHLTTALNLTKDEAEKFWTVYNVYDNKMSELHHNSTIKFLKKSSFDDLEKMSDKEALSKIQELNAFDDEYCSIRKQFLQDVQKILSAKKILILKKAEDEFNRQLLKKYKEKK